MTPPVCKRCGCTEFVQVCEVELRVEFTRKVLALAFHDDGSLSQRVAAHAEDDDAEEALRTAIDEPDTTCFACRRCDLTADELSELVIVMPAAGVKVNLPDGSTRTASRVYIGHWKTGDEYPPDAKLDSAARITLAFFDPYGNGVETYALEDVELWEPNPDQLTLEAA